VSNDMKPGPEHALRPVPHPPKRSDLVAEEIKRLMTSKNLLPGDRLPRENELQELFNVSKGTVREALKSLEVQGLIKVSTGPGGGGMAVEVPLDRAFQLLQNYLFFKEVSIEDIYRVRYLLEPELAASAVPQLTEEEFDALERNIQVCDPGLESQIDPYTQRQEDLTFHDILASASPNPFLRFVCEMINQMLRQLTVYDNKMELREQQKFGATNVDFHRQLLAAARARDVDGVRELMRAHMHDAQRSVKRLQGRLHGRLILDSEMSRRGVAARAERLAAASSEGTTPTRARKKAVKQSSARKVASRSGAIKTAVTKPSARRKATTVADMPTEKGGLKDSSD
jgi:Transcriptional regulators